MVPPEMEIYQKQNIYLLYIINSERFFPSWFEYSYPPLCVHIFIMVLITEMLEICIQTSYDQNVHLILKSYLPVVYGTTLNKVIEYHFAFHLVPIYLHTFFMLFFFCCLVVVCHGFLFLFFLYYL
jgi:hypothetical protein